MGKIVNAHQLDIICGRLRSENKVVVSTNGCFDILHVGHVYLLEQAKELGDVLIVAINSNDSVKRLKGAGRPFVSGIDRATLLAGLSSVDYVVIFDEDTPVVILDIIKPNIHCKGEDYKLSDIIEKDIVEQHGGKIELLPIYGKHSTTNLVGKVLNHHGNINVGLLSSVVEMDDDHEWGYELRLVNNPLYCGKFLVYTNNEHPGSLHFHRLKTETFKVLSGEVLITRKYTAGDEVIVPKGYEHRIGALTEHAVVMEVSTHHADTDTYRLPEGD